MRKKTDAAFYFYACAVAVMSIIAVCKAADNQELFSVDVGQQKANIEKEFGKIDEWIPAAKLREISSSLSLIEHKTDRLRKNISKDDIASYQARADKIKKIISVKEDSLVNEAMKLLHSQGPDAALAFMQNDLASHGVAENKLGGLEKKILEEAPAIKQEQERDALKRTLALLESGKLPDSSIDPYIIKTAELIMKARADSAKNIEKMKNQKDMEEREKAERARMDSALKEKQKDDARLEKQRQEDEKKRLADEQRLEKQKQDDEKKRLADEQRLEKQKQDDEKKRLVEEQQLKKLHAQQEKAQKDSLENEAKIQKRKDELSRESQKRIDDARKEKEKPAYSQTKTSEPLPVKQEKAHADSIQPVQKENVQVLKASAMKQKQVLAQQEKAKKDSIESSRKENERLAKAEDLRQKQLLVQQAKMRKDSIEADKKDKERAAKAEDEQRKKLLIEQELARKDSIKQKEKINSEKQSVKQETQPKIVKYEPNKTADEPTQKQVLPPPVSSSERKPRVSSSPEQNQPEAVSQNAQEYLKKLQANQKEAQKYVMDLYALIGANKGKEALTWFKQNRIFIGKYVDVQVFNVLEQNIMQSVMETQSLYPSATPESQSPPEEVKKVSPDQERIDRINGLVRENKIEGAYNEFKRSEKRLKEVMPKNDFKLLKSMVENSYKTYKSSNK